MQLVWEEEFCYQNEVWNETSAIRVEGEEIMEREEGRQLSSRADWKKKPGE